MTRSQASDPRDGFIRECCRKVAGRLRHGLFGRAGWRHVDLRWNFCQQRQISGLIAELTRLREVISKNDPEGELLC